MTFKYLYQDRHNKNCEGEIVARTRDEAYTLLRKQGIRPYRVIGDDPWNWRPWAIAAGYAVLLVALVAASIAALVAGESAKRPKIKLTEDEAQEFRLRAEDAVLKAPSAYRYNVWKGVNARLEERGLEPLPKPAGLEEDETE